MKVYEFYFNPPLKEKDKLESKAIFETFYHEPKNIYEKRMGKILIVGELKNPLPKNLNFLQNCISFIRENYYKKPIINPEKALKNSLNLANEFLEGLISKGDVSWLGNLNFLVLVEKDFKIYFTKVGSIRLMLIHGNKLIDIEKKIKIESLESMPFKIFGNVIRGKVSEGDVILIFSKEIYEFFEEENKFLELTASLDNLESFLKTIFEQKKEKTSQLQGILVAVFFSKRESLGSKEIITTSLPLEFSLKKIFSFYFQKLKNVLSPYFFQIKKRGILVAVFLLLFLLAKIFVIFEARIQMRKLSQEIKIIESNLANAISLLSKSDLKNKQEAQLFLKDNVKRISPFLLFLSKFPEDFSKKVLEMDNTTRSLLLKLNSFEEIKEPKEMFKLSFKKFVPERFLVFKNNFFFFSPYLKNVYVINEEKKESILEVGRKIALGCVTNDLVIFYSRPNYIFLLANGKIQTISFSLPFPNPDFGDLDCRDFSLYFYDKNSGYIVKYSLLKPADTFKITEPQILLEKPAFGISLGVDENFWILQEKSILKIKDNKTEKMTLDIFPEIKQFKKIFLAKSLPILFILEPLQKRILIFDKSGKLLKQIYSEKFNNLSDLFILEEEKKLLLLNGLIIYEVSF